MEQLDPRDPSEGTLGALSPHRARGILPCRSGKLYIIRIFTPWQREIGEARFSRCAKTVHEKKFFQCILRFAFAGRRGVEAFVPDIPIGRSERSPPPRTLTKHFRHEMPCEFAFFPSFLPTHTVVALLLGRVCGDAGSVPDAGDDGHAAVGGVFGLLCASMIVFLDRFFTPRVLVAVGDAMVQSAMEECFKRCVDRPKSGGKLDPRQQQCISNCNAAFMSTFQVAVRCPAGMPSFPRIFRSSQSPILLCHLLCVLLRRTRCRRRCDHRWRAVAAWVGDLLLPRRAEGGSAR